MQQNDFLTLRQAADEYNMSLDRLRKAAADGRLHTRWNGAGHREVHRSEILRFQKDPRARAALSPVATAPMSAHLAKTVVIAVPKGGSGKTTTATSLAAARVERGERILLIDTDPQAGCTKALGVRVGPHTGTLDTAITRWLDTDEADLRHAITTTASGIDLVPASVQLTETERRLLAETGGESVLQALVETVQDDYDGIIIDTFPSFGQLVINALVAATGVIVPCMPAFLDAESLDLMVKQVGKIRKRKLNPDLQILGIVFTKVEPRAVVDRDFMDAIRARYPDIPVCAHVIPRTEAVKQAQAQQLTVLEYQPNGSVAQAYRAVMEEVWHGVTA